MEEVVKSLQVGKMKFPEIGDKRFKKEEVALLDAWRKKMEQTSEGRRIIENFRKGNKVSEDIWVKFLKSLVNQIKEGDSEVDAIRKAIKDEMLLKGPLIDRKHLPAGFSKLVKARSLFRYLNGNIPIFKGIEGQKQICKLIDNRMITLEKSFKKVKLRGQKPIVWATFSDEVEKQRLIHDDTNDLCDKLGLLDFDKCEDVIELSYESSQARNIRFPTIIEGGDNPAFHPSDHEDEYGYTWDLKNRDWGLPEVVHEPISFQNMDSIHYLGHKSRNCDLKF
jgi:hypothetical protein